MSTELQTINPEELFKDTDFVFPMTDGTTHKDIDDYIFESFTSGNITYAAYIDREIKAKLDVGALLHPAEEYFLEEYFLKKFLLDK